MESDPGLRLARPHRLWPLLLAMAFMGHPSIPRAEEPEKPESPHKRRERQEYERAYDLFRTAEKQARAFLCGSKPDARREDLMGRLADDPNVFNVVCTFTRQSKGKPFPVQHALRADNEHMNIKQTSRGCVMEGVNITFGFTNSDRPIFIATKYYPPAEGDKSNLGAELMVIVYAKGENR